MRNRRFTEQLPSPQKPVSVSAFDLQAMRRRLAPSAGLLDTRLAFGALIGPFLSGVTRLIDFSNAVCEDGKATA
jgi:hypothetical protein